MEWGVARAAGWVAVSDRSADLRLAPGTGLIGDVADTPIFHGGRKHHCISLESGQGVESRSGVYEGSDTKADRLLPAVREGWCGPWEASATTSFSSHPFSSGRHSRRAANPQNGSDYPAEGVPVPLFSALLCPGWLDSWKYGLPSSMSQHNNLYMKGIQTVASMGGYADGCMRHWRARCRSRNQGSPRKSPYDACHNRKYTTKGKSPLTKYE